jgi:hypothetical protein
MKKKLVVSFSGGKTSGFMAKFLHDNFQHQFEMIFCFANTGEEDEKTLQFVHNCDQEFGFNVVWLEAITHPDTRIGCTHKIVNFWNASRNGEPFEAMIQKYGIPNKSYPHCTRELKLNPIRSYLESVKWFTGDYITAVGIRQDEPKRIRKKAPELNIVYPLFHWFPTVKAEINEFWEEQTFNLGLEEHQGNCRWCWKKSLRKHMMIASENPKAFEFPARMEALYGLNGHNIDGTKRVFFRGNTSTIQLIQISTGVVPPPPSDPDEDSGCSESCDAYAELEIA